MGLHCLVPLTITGIAAWVSFGDWFGSLDDLPRLLAAPIGVVCSLWFFITAPWLLQLSLLIGLMFWGNIYLGKVLNSN